MRNKPIYSIETLFLVQLAARYARANLYRDPKNRSESLSDLGKWIKDSLQDMGPVYVKIGQVVSTQSRIPVEISDALESLQDDAVGVPFSEMDVVVPSNIVNIVDTPIAAASLGIVYKGYWCENNKTHPVAIKVLRKNIKSQLCNTLWCSARSLRRFSEYSQGINYLLDIARQYRRSIYRETDYMREARNIDKLANSMHGIRSWNKVPNVFAATKAYIVMEYLEGTKITDVDTMNKHGVSRPSVADDLLEAFLYQCLVGDIFHSDPHPGNISINFGAKSPHLVWYDCGSVVECSTTLKQEITKLSVYILKSDVDNVVVTLEEMGIVQQGLQSKKAITRLIRILLGSVGSSNPNKVMGDLAAMLETDPAWRQDLREALISNNGYVLLGKSVLVINLICLKLDPDFNLIKRSIPIMERFGNIADTSSINVYSEVTTVAKNIAQMPMRVSVLEKQINEMSYDINANQNKNYGMMNVMFVFQVVCAMAWLVMNG